MLSESVTAVNSGIQRRTKTIKTIINWSHALETALGDVTLLKELSAICLQESSDLLKQIDVAVDENDCPALRRASHTIKSHMRMFGAAEPERLAECIEATAAAGSVQVAEPLAQLQRELGQVHNQLRELLDGNIAL